jgi:uncharacterized repeat protein (TIGR01451 family)
VHARLLLLVITALLVSAAPASADPEADVLINMIDSPDPVNAGDALTYTIAVSNAGPGAAGDVEVEDQVPAGTTAVSASTSDGECDQPSPSTQVFSCELGTIAAGDSVFVTFVVQTSASTGSPIANVATVKADDDADQDNNTATTETTVTPAAPEISSSRSRIRPIRSPSASKSRTR